MYSSTSAQFMSGGDQVTWIEYESMPVISTFVGLFGANGKEQEHDEIGFVDAIQHMTYLNNKTPRPQRSCHSYLSMSQNSCSV